MTTIESPIAAQKRLTGRSQGLFTLAFAAAVTVSSTASTVARAESRPDVWVSTQVRTGLLTSDGLDHTNRIHVDTIDGRVTLHGTVANEEQSARAEEIARRVDGATRVRNALRVVALDANRGRQIADQEVERNLVAVLTRDAALVDSQIRVRSVRRGVALLGGRADTLSAHVRALEVAARVDGVRQVTSEISSPNALGDAEIWRDGAWDAQLASQSAAGDAWMTSAVKMRMLANTDTPGFDINVDSMNGVVTLFGVVDSQRTRSVASEEAMRVEGVRTVQDQLQVAPPSAQPAATSRDTDVQGAVQNRISANTLLSDADLDVAVMNGVVRMSGTVTSQVDRLTALTLARTSPGARRVIDDIRVVQTTAR